MSLLPLNPKNMLLESSVTRVFNNYNRLAYAHVGTDLTIVQTSDNFSFLLPEGMETAEGKPITEVVEELVGAEEQLDAILDKEQEAYVLEYVNRELTLCERVIDQVDRHLRTIHGAPHRLAMPAAWGDVV
jgi:hypothetical protein